MLQIGNHTHNFLERYLWLCIKLPYFFHMMVCFFFLTAVTVPYSLPITFLEKLQAFWLHATDSLW